MNARRLQLLLLLAAAALLAATFAQPTLQLLRVTYRYVFVFDISQSMNVRDVSADSTATRLEFAKKITLESLRELPCGTQIGVALFTGHRAFLLITPVEICANYRELATMVSRIDWRMTWEARSEIAKGIYKSIELLKALSGPPRLVFVTDGHEAPPINPEVAPQFVDAKGVIRGLIVGVGGDLPVPIPKFDEKGLQQGFWKVDEVMHIDAFRAEQNIREGKQHLNTGTEHLSSLRETYLQELADVTGLTYHRLDDRAGFSRHLQNKALGIPKVATTDIRWLLALIALLALVAAMMSTKIMSRVARDKVNGMSEH